MPSPLATMKYDGKGRRIQKAGANTGSWDCTFKYYYDNDSFIEERNGSDYVIKENVWGTNYIDELVQTKAESDGTLSVSALSGTDSVFYACQDANYNVLGIVNGSGALIERYEYTPYGQRKTFFSSGSNDGLCYAPTMSSRRASSTAAWGKNEFGHQGLMHDEEIDLVYNRARHLHPGLGRFAQRDPEMYRDGMNLSAAVGCAPIVQRDPTGRSFTYGNYCGAGSPAVRIPPSPVPIDEIDWACYRHDMCYGAIGAAGWVPDPGSHCGVRECDRVLYNEMMRLIPIIGGQNQTNYQNLQAILSFFRGSCSPVRPSSSAEACPCKPPRTTCQGQ